MYTYFAVKNFRCFHDLELRDIERVNLITGVNNIGKTALLEALFLYCGAPVFLILMRTRMRKSYFG